MADAPPESPDPVFIRIRNLQKTFHEQTVLKGVSMDVVRGETLVVIGGSGSGKSVLLKHLIGLLHPDSGSVKVDGKEISGLTERQLVGVRRQIGVLFQDGALFDSLNVAENVAFPLVELGWKDRGEILERVRESLSVVDLEQHLTKMPINLSGGMRKRVALARAIVSRPECVLYDEPTAGLDPIVSDSIDILINRLKERLEMTSIVVTHDMKSVMKIADQVAYLRHGEIHFSGTAEELKASPDPLVQDFLEGRSRPIAEATAS